MKFHDEMQEEKERRDDKHLGNSEAKSKPKKRSKIRYGSGIRQVKLSEELKVRVAKKSLSQMEKEVRSYIIGQDKQVQQIITGIYRSLEFETIKSNMLILGKSGTGKTETIKQIAERLNLPYTVEDATKYTKEGYYGASVTDMVLNLIENANNNLERAQKGILIIDEIDKKVSHEKHDVGGVEVLKSLLKLVEGTKLKIPKESENLISVLEPQYIDFDTSNLIVIFLGAFSGIEKIKDKRLNRGKIGFGNGITNKLEDVQTRTIKQDLVAYGMPEEFVGRVDTIIEMNPLGEEELVKILTNSKLSIFRKYEKELLQKGVSLEYEDGLFEAIAKESLQLDTGARELSNTVNHMFEQIVYEVLANPNQYRKCVLYTDIVQDNTKFTLS